MSSLFRIYAALLLCLGMNLAQAQGLESLSSGDAAAGLKEALVQGADYAVGNLGVKDGFLGNKKVRIGLPDSLKSAEKAMRMFGMKDEADELVESMNRAAELAVAEAKPILMDAIRKMTVKDAKDILTGGDDSVTQYFRRSTDKPLTEKFLPIVKKATARVQLAEQYNNYAGQAAKLGLVDKKDANLDSYVTARALDGLYHVIGEQEKALRQNPLGASSDLLKKVFGAL
ncbi:DUF4197 domain-containing protein [Azovibrio restrictus]|uniref:DUF4197 domain-containing protein n=1 Tax=Azovibrio restrictus TaxID=146938 RepID=UPI00040891B7|nr:DUF4197 domain-containing protein [Azovibrio restrictus]MCE1171381.1 DUF4197 domain-containing protein [Azovibrio sp.]